MAITHEYKELTSSEKYLTHLCKDTFLNLWSWPHIYRKQRWNGGNGKEVCDLLVVFENNIIIFSDKYCKFPNTGDLILDWCRWFKKAIFQSAKQIWGAERWIRQYSNNLFLDKDCKIPFPYPLANIETVKFHRIVVAHGSSKRCQQTLGGSGSLMVNPNIVGQDHYNSKSCRVLPFTIGRIDDEKGFIHVLDDFNLDVILQTLDTITDFTNYLDKKQSFFESGKLGRAAGEEDLLAAYYLHLNEKGEHDFEIKENVDLVVYEEGFWENFIKDPKRISQIEANKISYLWDALIDEFSVHILGGTLYTPHTNKVDYHEKGLRILASEPRIRRRILSRNLMIISERAEREFRSVRVDAGVHPGEAYYVFLALVRKDGKSLEDYRIIRQNSLYNYCMAVKVKFPKAEKIVGIATEPISYQKRSHDLIYLDARNWTRDRQKEAEGIRNKYNLLVNAKMSQSVENEFPSEQIDDFEKSKNRHKPCYCGSGKKYRKCCRK